MYVANIRLEIVALLRSGLGHIHILAMGCGAVEIGGIGKGSKPSFESGGLLGDDVGCERGRVEDRRTLSY